VEPQLGIPIRLQEVGRQHVRAQDLVLNVDAVRVDAPAQLDAALSDYELRIEPVNRATKIDTPMCSTSKPMMSAWCRTTRRPLARRSLQLA
jgi:hypothetical protein